MDLINKVVEFYKTTETETGNNVLYASLCSLVLVLIAVSVVDFCLVRRIFKQPSTRYFTLHVMFNSWIVWVVWNDAIDSLGRPLHSMTEHHWVDSAVISTGGISGFHIYHMLAFTNLTTEDLWHHIGSCLVIPVFATSCPFGKAVSLSNLGMCGIPGGVDYLMLILVKQNWMNAMTEKRFNRYLNLVIRWPIQLITTYVIVLSWLTGLLTHIPSAIVFFMMAALMAHCWNAVYYADKVIGNYWVRLQDGKRKSGVSSLKKKEAVVVEKKPYNSPMGTRKSNVLLSPPAPSKLHHS